MGDLTSDKYEYALDNIYVVGSYGYMIPVLGMSEEEVTILALAMAESGVGGRTREEYYRQIRKQCSGCPKARAASGAFFNGTRLSHATVYIGTSKPSCDCQRLFRTIKGKFKKWCTW